MGDASASFINDSKSRAVEDYHWKGGKPCFSSKPAGREMACARRETYLRYSMFQVIFFTKSSLKWKTRITIPFLALFVNYRDTSWCGNTSGPFTLRSVYLGYPHTLSYAKCHHLCSMSVIAFLNQDADTL